MVRDPELSEDRGFQERLWRIERIAWIAGALTVVAGLGGLFGNGPLAAREVRCGPGVSLRFDRFARVGSRTEWKIQAEAGAMDEAPVLFISDSLVQGNEFETIGPPASEWQRAPGGWYVHFPGGRHSQGFAAGFRVVPRRAGWITGTISGGTPPGVKVGMWTWP